MPPMPQYKERALDREFQAQQGKFPVLLPEDLMSPAEHKETKRLLRAREAAGSSQGDHLDQSVRDRASQRLSELAWGALLRKLRLEKFMGVDVERDDGYRVKFQLLDAGFSEVLYHRGSYTWHLGGRGLRKDGTLGQLRTGVTFSEARIKRRMLTGDWVQVAPMRRLGSSMNIEPRSLPFGVGPRILIDCARQLRYMDEGFNLDDFCEALGAPPREALPILNRLFEEGFVSSGADAASYSPTKKLKQLAAAKISSGLTRAEAEQLLQRIIFKAAEVNAHPDTFPCAVQCLVVFGSCLGNSERLGDLDLGVAISDPPRLAPRGRRFDLRAELDASTSASTKTFAALRLRKPRVVSLHTLKEVMHLGTSYRIVFGVLPADQP